MVIGLSCHDNKNWAIWSNGVVNSYHYKMTINSGSYTLFILVRFPTVVFNYSWVTKPLKQLQNHSIYPKSMHTLPILNGISNVASVTPKGDNICFTCLFQIYLLIPLGVLEISTFKERQTDRQTDRLTDWQTDRLADWQMTDGDRWQTNRPFSESKTTFVFLNISNHFSTLETLEHYKH